MSVNRCHVCDANPAESRHLGESGLVDGQECPICYRPTCRYHLVTVRWRWRDDTREIASTQICRECHRTYEHRRWDTFERDWIS